MSQNRNRAKQMRRTKTENGQIESDGRITHYAKNFQQISNNQWKLTRLKTLREGNNVLNKYENHLGQILEMGTEFCGARKT